MTVADDVRAFLRAPVEFAAGLSAGSAERWLAGLKFADRPDAPLGRALRPAQRDAWRGSADQRAALMLGPPGTG
jgi:hypothetical protein